MSSRIVRKCFFGCDNRSSLYALPRDESNRKQWELYVSSTQPPANFFLCVRHFTDDCFVNKGQYDAGFARFLLLKPGAVPSVKITHGGFKLRAGTPQQAPSTSAGRSDPREQIPVSEQATGDVVSVGPQISSASTVTVRSKDTPYIVSCFSLATNTTTQDTGSPLSSSTSIKTPAAAPGVRPAKRPRLDSPEKEEEEGESMSDIQEPHDPTYHPRASFTEQPLLSETESASHHSEAKYVVFESCLRELFETCPLCKRDCDVQQQKLGTYVAFTQKCPNCQYARKWQSQPVRGSTPVGNLQMSAGVYFTGASFFQLQKICKAINLQLFQYDTFQRHARMYLEPAINHKWKKDQEAVLHDLQQKGRVAVGGAMRADSPGHSAKYGSYTFMSLDDNKIIDLQLVQSNEVGGSVHMEKEGLRRGLDYLQSQQVDIDYIVTDRHPQVQSFLREKSITHYYDVRHLEKSLSKKLTALAKKKECQVVSTWLPGIKNQMYWAATSSKTGPEKVAKWKSTVTHIQDIHIHHDTHGPKHLHGSAALYKVEKVLLNKRVLHDVEKLSNQQTSSLETFHRVIPHFAPKNLVLPFIGMLCRLYLAAMHFNENAEWDQAVTAKEKPVCRVTAAKSKEGKSTAKAIRIKPTFTYMRDLMTLVFEEVFTDPAPYIEELKRIPVPEDLCTV